MSGQHIIIEQLRADVERLTKLHGRELLERMEAERERDARPDISAEDARAFMMFKPVPARDSREGPVMHALRAHAQKARPVCTCTRGLGDYCPTPDPDCKAHAQKEVKP